MFEVKYLVKPEINLVVCEIFDNDGTKFRGAARCRTTDNFNENVGKRIAFVRANAKRNKRNVAYYNRVYKAYKCEVEYATAQMRKYAKKIQKAKQVIANVENEVEQIYNQNN